MLKWLAKRRLAKQKALLERQHRKLLEEARDLQRSGDIQAFATKTAEAEDCAQRLYSLVPTKHDGQQPS